MSEDKRKSRYGDVTEYPRLELEVRAEKDQSKPRTLQGGNFAAINFDIKRYYVGTLHSTRVSSRIGIDQKYAIPDKIQENRGKMQENCGTQRPLIQNH